MARVYGLEVYCYFVGLSGFVVAEGNEEAGIEKLEDHVGLHEDITESQCIISICIANISRR